MDFVTDLGVPPASAVDLSRLVASLERLGVDEILAASAASTVPVHSIAVLIYGSFARGDWNSHSDVDLLIVADSFASSSQAVNAVSASYYSLDQIKSASGTLFGMHLARDGLILHDTDQQLSQELQQFEDPDPTDLMLRINRLSSVVNLPDHEIERYIEGSTKVARYLLRTATYVRALANGEPCFSVDELAGRFQDPELRTLLSSHQGIQPPATIDAFRILKSRLERLAGTSPTPDFESLQALIVGLWDSDPDIANLALLALSKDEDELPYSEMAKVIL